MTEPNMQTLNTVSNFKFSAVTMDSLGASKYTLVTIAVDRSGSMSGMERNVERCLKEILASLNSKSAPSENLMLRVTSFNQSIEEVHGFRGVCDIPATEYDNSFTASGGTALCDAVLEAVESSNALATILKAQDYACNAVVFVITDGADAGSTHGPDSVKRGITTAQKAEKLDSVAVVLIGVGPHGAGSVLSNFQQATGITQFADMEEEFRKGGAGKAFSRLGGLIVKSVSSTSQALMSGTSQPIISTLTF